VESGNELEREVLKVEGSGLPRLIFKSMKTSAKGNEKAI
jgi:hypothetical protein